MLVELEVEDLEVFADTRGRDGFGDDDETLLQMPADDHLRRRLAVLLCDLRNGRIVERGAAAERAIGLDLDPLRLMERAHLPLLILRMELDLVDGRRDAGLAD